MQLWRYGQPPGIPDNHYGLEAVAGRDSVGEVLLALFGQLEHRLSVHCFYFSAFASAIPPRRSAVPPSAFQRSRTPTRSARATKHPPSRPRGCFSYWGVALIGCVLALGLVLWFFILPLLTQQATVTLIPRSQVIQNTLALSAAQVHARQISATASPQSATGKTSGTIPATKATGTLTFLNQAGADVTIQSAVITDKQGVQVSFTGPLLVPATSNNASATASATAVQAGASGNIPSFAITMPCCAPNREIVVENTTAFTGGADAQPDDRVLQGDIDQAADPLKASQTQQEQTQLAAQVRNNEQVIPGTMQCQPQVKSDVPVGAQATSVTVTVTVTCSEQVYDQEAAQAQATSLLNAQAPMGYMLSGQVSVSMLSMSDANTIQLHAQGRWLYHFSQTQLNQFARLIANQSQTQARALLRQQTGIFDTRISGPATLPSADRIQIQVHSEG